MGNSEARIFQVWLRGREETILPEDLGPGRSARKLRLEPDEECSIHQANVVWTLSYRQPKLLNNFTCRLGGLSKEGKTLRRPRAVVWLFQEKAFSSLSQLMQGLPSKLFFLPDLFESILLYISFKLGEISMTFLILNESPNVLELGVKDLKTNRCFIQISQF